ncbi:MULTISPECIES: DUF4123 domain-containing protein [Acidithiobacillus]|uniref:DUF4123 domain-containing protein n=1 Tax=Acidithiobacillus ferrivorans TaxID=160808 RepID=UPI001C06B760|nr:DUF4123 domain-containing protein [Acidithiobacillus ferrivorans]MBU2852088.1 DUF4123 domain-containing protein [Acidithiobacillus ferrivorans]
MQGSEAIYVLIDLARSPDMYPRMNQMARFTSQHLYSGDIAPKVLCTTPHLAPMPKGSGLMDWWREPEQRELLVACRTRVSQEVLRTHFRTLLRARFPDGNRYLFRFWDPRVLHTYLTQANTYERAAFFGPIESFYFHPAAGLDMLEWHNALAEDPRYDPHAGGGFGKDGVPISQRTLNAFAPLRRDALLVELFQYARRKLTHWSEALGDTELKRRVRVAVEHAETYGFKNPATIRAYFTQMTLTPNFDQVDEVRQILLDNCIPEDKKITACSKLNVTVLSKVGAIGQTWPT